MMKPFKSTVVRNKETVAQAAQGTIELDAAPRDQRDHHEWLEKFPSQSDEAGTPREVVAGAGAAAFEEFRAEIRELVDRLSRDCQQIRETSLQASQDALAAITAVKDSAQRVGPLAQLDDLNRSTEAKVAALNALAEHISLKAKALERQEAAVEHAVVQANRVNEMVWAMDQQITRLNDAMKQAETSQETLARIDHLSEQTASRLSAAQKLYDQTHAETARLEMHAASLLESLQAQVGVLELRKKESDSLNERLRVIHGAIAGTEGRITAMNEKEKQIVELMQRTSGLAIRIEGLTSRTEELTTKQVTFEALHDKFAQFHELAKTTAHQIEVLQESRRNLDVARKDIQDFHRSHDEIAQLGAKLGSDRDALDLFDRRMSALVTRAPELEAKVDTILHKLALVDEATQKATVVNDCVAQLDARITRVTARVPLVEKLEARLNALTMLSAGVDQRISDQLARRHELETFINAHESLAIQLADIRPKLEDVRGVQQTLLPLIAEARKIESFLDTVRARVAGMKVDEAALAEHQARFEGLEASSRTLQAEMAEHVQQAQGLTQELERAAGLQDELMEELDRVESRQRDLLRQIDSQQDQVSRAGEMFEHLTQLGSELAGDRKTIADLEGRLAEIRQAARDIENDVQAVVSRADVVRAVKEEVVEVHEISVRSRAELDHVMEHSAELSAVRARLDRLLRQVAETDDRVASIEANRQLVDEVHHKTNSIVQLFEDIQINLESIGEQKAIIEEMGKRVTQLQFAVQNAENSLHSLQRERELAQRIESGILQLRTKAGRADEGKKPE